MAPARRRRDHKPRRSARQTGASEGVRGRGGGGRALSHICASRQSPRVLEEFRGAELAPSPALGPPWHHWNRRKPSFVWERDRSGPPQVCRDAGGALDILRWFRSNIVLAMAGKVFYYCSSHRRWQLVEQYLNKVRVSVPVHLCARQPNAPFAAPNGPFAAAASTPQTHTHTLRTVTAAHWCTGNGPIGWAKGRCPVPLWPPTEVFGRVHAKRAGQVIWRQHSVEPETRGLKISVMGTHLNVASGPGLR